MKIVSEVVNLQFFNMSSVLIGGTEEGRAHDRIKAIAFKRAFYDLTHYFHNNSANCGRIELGMVSIDEELNSL